MELTAIGVTAFPPDLASTYRFVVTSQSDKVEITLEDLKRAGFLDDKEYITGTNKIPNASLSDYVKVFKDTLEYLMDKNDKIGELNDSKLNKVDTGKIRRKLIPLENDILQLELSVKIRVLQNAWTAKYLFRLEPVFLDTVDILKAKIRDVEEELKEMKAILKEEQEERIAVDEEVKLLKNKVANMKNLLDNAGINTPPVYLIAASGNVDKLNDKGQIVWKTVNGVGFVPSKDNSTVRFKAAGWYMINITVYLAPQVSGTSVELRLNDKYFQSQLAPFNAGQNTSVVFSTTAHFKKDEFMLIASASPLRVGADLRVFKIGA